MVDTSSPFTVASLRYRHKVDPLGFDGTPYFSWAFAPDGCAHRQTAYRLCVATSRSALDAHQPDVWDSGDIPSTSTVCAHFPSARLRPRTRYHWTVTVRDHEGRTATADPATFETGKLNEPWQGKWIAAPFIRLDRTDEGAPYFRTTFDVPGDVKRARLYICGLGLYQAFIEGRRVSDYELEPPYTKYDHDVKYRTYDVTESLRGLTRATLGVVLGNGWYNLFVEDGWNGPQSTWRAVPKFIAELHLEGADGSTSVVRSDERWLVTDGPIIFNSIRAGEKYDARRENPAWALSSATPSDLADWEAAKQVRGPGGLITASEDDPIRITETLRPARQFVNDDGHLILDMGQNFAGRMRIHARGPKGATFTLRHAEKLTDDGQHVDQTPISSFIFNSDVQTDAYTKGTDDPETWQSVFTYHGFRYVEVEGWCAAVKDTTFEGLVIHTDYASTGFFESSHEGLNRIQSMTRWSDRANSMGLPTTDPQREKNSWTGDLVLAIDQFFIHFDCFTMFRKWMDDLVACQRPDGSLPCFAPTGGWGYTWGNGPDWSLIFTILPWRLYLHTADIELLRTYYPAVLKHYRFMRGMADDYIVSYGIGDWCAPFDGPALGKNMGSFATPTALTDTACFLETANLLNRMCAEMGQAFPYADDIPRIKQAMRDRFIGDDLTVAGDCQTADACVLFSDILTDDETAIVLGHLLRHIEAKDGHLDFGILGSRYVMETLGAHGKMDTLFTMLTKDTYPSYLYAAKQGLTTLMECWNLGGSRNHVMFSYVSYILYKYIAGLELFTYGPGYRTFNLRPSLLTDTMDCRFTSPDGDIAIAWQCHEDHVDLSITLPPNAQGYLYPPRSVAASASPELLQGGDHEITWRL